MKAAVLAVGLFLLADAAVIVEGAPRVIDGDTLHIPTDSGLVRVRLAELDAPELGEPGGQAAWDRMRELAGFYVECRLTGAKTYGREVGYCTNEAGQDVAEELIREGLARQFRRFGDSYLEAEKQARFAKRGMWSGN